MGVKPIPGAAGACAKRGRYWAVTDAAGQLVCLAVYKKGGQEALRRLRLASALTARTKRRTRPKGQVRGV